MVSTPALKLIVLDRLRSVKATLHQRKMTRASPKHTKPIISIAHTPLLCYIDIDIDR